MRAWKTGVRFDAPSSVTTPTTTITPSTPTTTTTPSTPTTTIGGWTPELVAGMSIRWHSFGDDSPQNFVLVRPRNGKFLVVRVDEYSSTPSTKKAVGWRMMENKSRGVSRVVLIRTNAPRSRKHWVLDEASSNPGVSLTWRRAGKEMIWVRNPKT